MIEQSPKLIHKHNESKIKSNIKAPTELDY